MQPHDNPTREELTPVKRALLELRELRAQLHASERWKREPVAIVGTALRLPGGIETPAAFWDVLQAARDVITEIPRERWDVARLFDPDPDKPGKMTCRYGGFLSCVDQFDPEFFGITPREAESMDPQHRLLLEVVWEGLESAGIAPSSLAGSRTGVFLAISNSDYSRQLMAELKEVDAYASMGGAWSVAAGRVSYFLGAHGPSLVVDTSCSSSLTALHLACQSLRLDECETAIVGGVNLILSPEVHISFSKTRMLAPDGRCKTFDAAADGYVRGEGCATVILKRLSDAQAAGDRILAVIRGSALNQDGRSAGLTAPNGPAQEAVITAALASAGIGPLDVDYVETHGTGTPLGDPIEVHALAATYGQGRAKNQPLRIGSVKTNVGHLEAAAGMAGLLKVILSFEYGALPPHLNLRQPNPYIEWDSLPIEVVTSKTAWPRTARRRIAGLSSFGFSGTNAHVILEEPPPAAPLPAIAQDRPAHLLCLSAKTAPALRELAVRYEQHLASTADRLEDICYSANAGRSHHPHRLAVRAGTLTECREQLALWIAGREAPNAVAGAALEGTPQIAFLFTGQGSQYTGMGRRLYESSPVFRAALDRCAEVADPLLPKPLLSVIYPEKADGAALHETAWTQPALFAIEYALAELWLSWGIEPAVVIGHSIGEYVAACVAGAIPLEAALTLVIHRGALMQSLPAGGAMAAVFAPEDAVREAIAPYAQDVAIAAVNGPGNIVISGRAESVEKITGALATTGVHTKPLRVSHAFHSPLLDPILDAFEKRAAAIEFSTPRIAFVSNLTGKLEHHLSAKYWRRHTREAVRFSDGVWTILENGPHVLLEIGPDPVLSGMVLRALPDQPATPSLRSGRDDWDPMLESLQVLYTRGASIDWAAFDRGYPRAKVALPLYPFQHKRYWLRHGWASQNAGLPRSAWNSIQAAAARQSEFGPLGWDIRNYEAKVEALTRLTFAHARSALVELGAFQSAGESHTPAGLMERYGIPAIYGRLIARWLRGLAAEGHLEMQGDRFTSARPLQPVDLAPYWAEAQRVTAGDPGALLYLKTFGEKLGAIIAGRESPLETLFPGGSLDIAEGVYEQSLEGRYLNPVVAAAVAAAGASLTGKGDLRILEAGGGTGGTTSYLLPYLPADRTEYWFTDVSDQFLTRARAKFAPYRFVRYVRMDLDHALEPQGIPARSFDLVVAANVVHVMRDIGAALERIRNVLAPGGLLILIEITRHHAWFDMSTGLLEGFQQFDDPYRGEHALLDSEKWLEVLKQHGFETAEQFPKPGSLAEAIGHHVLIARAPAAEVQLPYTVAGSVVELQAVAPEPNGEAAAYASETAAALNAAPDAERREILLDYVAGCVKQLFRLDRERVLGPRERLTDLGMDSLMALELKSVLARGLDIEGRLPSTIAFDAGTVSELAAALEEILFGPAAQTPAAVETTAPVVTAEQLSELSDEDVEALLMERLRTN